MAPLPSFLCLVTELAKKSAKCLPVYQCVISVTIFYYAGLYTLSYVVHLLMRPFNRPLTNAYQGVPAQALSGVC